MGVKPEGEDLLERVKEVNGKVTAIEARVPEAVETVKKEEEEAKRVEEERRREEEEEERLVAEATARLNALEHTEVDGPSQPSPPPSQDQQQPQSRPPTAPPVPNSSAPARPLPTKGRPSLLLDPVTGHQHGGTPKMTAAQNSKRLAARQQEYLVARASKGYSKEAEAGPSQGFTGKLFLLLLPSLLVDSDSRQRCSGVRVRRARRPGDFAT